MKIDLYEYTNDKEQECIKIEFIHHRAVIFSSEINATEKNVLATKLKVIDEYLQTFNPRYTQKEILKEWAKFDEQMKEYYKTFDQRGGSRKGSGRKVGSYSNGVKSDRTEHFTMAINKQEKEYLKKCLEEYRNNLSKTINT